MISLMIFLGTYIVYTTTDYAPWMRIVSDQEKAYQVALGGVNVALAQLTAMPSEQKDKLNEKTLAVTLLQTLLPKLNQWQTYQLKKGQDGVQAELKVCISCEDGKIDINSIYDFATHKFMGEGQAQNDTKKAVEFIFKRMSEITKQQDCFKGFEKFLKERQYKLNDVTELLLIKEFELFKGLVWYEPPMTQEEKKEK